MQSCIIFLSHHTQPGAMASLASLERQCESAFTIVPLFDHTKGAFPINPVPERERVRALLPLYRLSNTALRTLHNAYSEGWSG